MPRLFSYGTLQLAQVQLATFGRLLNGTAAQLPGYLVGQLEITDPAVLATSGERFHPILRTTSAAGAAVDGSVFELTDTELAAADRYEVADYQRREALLGDGSRCWIYAAAE